MAVEGPVELNLRDRLIRPATSRLDVLAEPDHRKYPAPGADQVALLIERRPGVDDRAAVPGCRIDTGDHATRHRSTRITSSGEDDRHRSIAAPLQLRMRSKIAGSGGVEESTEWRCQAGQQGLGLGVAEPCVELDHPNTAGCQCQAGVQQSAERRAAPGHLINSWLQHSVADLFDKIIRRPRQRRIGAHAAGIGPGVPIANPLEVLRGLQRPYGPPVGYGEQAHLRPIEKLLDHHPTAAHCMINSDLPIAGHYNALAGGQAIVLDDIRWPELIERLVYLVARHTVSGASGRHTGRCHHLLGEGLAAFQACCGCRWAEAGDSSLAYGIGHTRHQWRLGPNDDQADSEPGCQTRDGMAVKRIEAMIRAQCSSAGVPRRSVQLGHGGVAIQRQSERMLAPARADHQHPQWTHHGPRAYPSVQARRASLREAPNQVAFRTVADPSFPTLHIRPSQGWLNDPNGLCRIDGRYHVFFQYNPVSPVHEAISWGHVSSADLIHWQQHPVALAPRPGLIDGGGCWSGCVIDDAGVPTAVYTANPDHARNAVAAVARSDRSLIRWEQDVSPVLGISKASGLDEVRDPFIFIHQGRRYAIQGAGHPLESARLLLYGCDDLKHWTELGTLLTADDPVAAKAAAANIWECPNLVQIDGQWVLLLSLWHLVNTVHRLAGVRYLLGDLVPQDQGWVFKATSGGVVDDGPAFYAPQVLVEPNRTLLWAWAWELGRSVEQIAETGWAGVLTFPRELYVRNGVLGMRPAHELTGLRRGCLALQPGQPFQAQAFELLASGPVALRLADEGVDVLVSSAEGTPADPARILVDGSMVETFHHGASHTTRAYPTANSSWVVDGAEVTAYRLGSRVAVAAGAGV